MYNYSFGSWPTAVVLVLVVDPAGFRGRLLQTCPPVSEVAGYSVTRNQMTALGLLFAYSISAH